MYICMYVYKPTYEGRCLTKFVNINNLKNIWMFFDSVQCLIDVPIRNNIPK